MRFGAARVDGQCLFDPARTLRRLATLDERRAEEVQGVEAARHDGQQLDIGRHGRRQVALLMGGDGARQFRVLNGRQWRGRLAARPAPALLAGRHEV